MYTCASVCLSVCLSVCQFIYLSISLPAYQQISILIAAILRVDIHPLQNLTSSSIVKQTQSSQRTFSCSWGWFWWRDFAGMSPTGSGFYNCATLCSGHLLCVAFGRCGRFGRSGDLGRCAGCCCYLSVVACHKNQVGSFYYPGHVWHWAAGGPPVADISSLKWYVTSANPKCSIFIQVWLVGCTHIAQVEIKWTLHTP